VGKRIIICCDGTNQKFQENRTNPLRLYYCLDNTKDQISFYDPGVGTFDRNGPDFAQNFLERISSTVTRTLEGSAMGYGIVQNIRDAYRYLMNVYEDGDKIYLFGFSRGAFTAQAVAGLLNKCGLIYRHNDNLIDYVLEIYLQRGNRRIAKEFKETMARPECKPHFIGVWDTVESLGPSHKDDFFYDKLGNNCDHGYHAVAVDETRDDFCADCWHDMAANLEEVWFTGWHGDVGGGLHHDGLSNIPLHWMISKAAAHGVTFREDRCKEFENEMDPLAPIDDPFRDFKWRLRGREPRAIPKGSKIHKSVFQRTNDPATNYKPQNLPAEKDSLIVS